jgi:sigma-E factor negative regulatory protein RseC
MKPSVPETGIIIRIEGDNAVIRLKGGKSCKGCGMGEIGLCRAGDTSMLLTAKNVVKAGVGETVQVGLDRKTKVKGYFMAYLIPIFALMAGTVAGDMLGGYFSMPALDAIGGFLMLMVASLLSFRKLRKLDAAHMMVANKIISDNIFTGEVKSEEERWYPKYIRQ